MKAEFRQRREPAKKTIFDGGLAFGLVIGLSIALLIWLANSFWAFGLTRDDAIHLVPSLATATVAFVSLAISLLALGEQRRMRQAGTDPVLIAHLGQKSDQPLLVTLNISNVGSGAAMNVVIHSQVPHNADEKHLVGEPFKADVLGARRSLKVILQSEKVVFDLGTGLSLLQDKPLQPFEVALDYQDIEGREYSSRHIIDVLELEARSAGEPSITRIWRELEKIAKRI